MLKQSYLLLVSILFTTIAEKYYLNQFILKLIYKKNSCLLSNQNKYYLTNFQYITSIICIDNQIYI